MLALKTFALLKCSSVVAMFVHRKKLQDAVAKAKEIIAGCKHGIYTVYGEPAQVS